jgi:hypothetical protein
MYPLAQSHRPGVPAFPLAGHHSSNDILASLERGLQVLRAREAGSGAHSAVAQGGAAQGASAQRGTSAQVTRFHPYRRRGLQLLDVTNAVAIRAKNLSVFTDVQLKRISKGNGNKAMADQLPVQGGGHKPGKFLTAWVNAQVSCAKVNASAVPRFETPLGVEAPSGSELVGTCSGGACYIHPADERTVYLDPTELVRLQGELRCEQEKNAELQGQLRDARASSGTRPMLTQFAMNCVSTLCLALYGANGSLAASYLLILVEVFERGDKDCHDIVFIVLVGMLPDEVIPQDMICLFSKWKKVQMREGREAMMLSIPAGTKVKDINKGGQVCVKLMENIESQERRFQLGAADFLRLCPDVIEIGDGDKEIKVTLDQLDRCNVLREVGRVRMVPCPAHLVSVPGPMPCLHRQRNNKAQLRKATTEDVATIDYKPLRALQIYPCIASGCEKVPILADELSAAGNFQRPRASQAISGRCRLQALEG